MLIHPWDAATGAAEWRAWLSTRDIGTLIASGRGRDVPVVVPTHFVYEGVVGVEGVGAGRDTVVLHLARPNPLLVAVQENPKVVLAVSGDWAYIPAAWKATPGEDPALGIPTSYYAAVQLVCTATLLEGDELLEVLRTQLDHFEPGSGVADPEVHRRQLSGIRGLRLVVDEVQAKFKYGGNADDEHRAVVADNLRRTGQQATLAQLLRRTEEGVVLGREAPDG